jgi:hypothetical protein
LAGAYAVIIKPESTLARSESFNVNAATGYPYGDSPIPGRVQQIDISIPVALQD